jgi:hypothetical protein
MPPPSSARNGGATGDDEDAVGCTRTPAEQEEQEEQGSSRGLVARNAAAGIAATCALAQKPELSAYVSHAAVACAAYANHAADVCAPYASMAASYATVNNALAAGGGLLAVVAWHFIVEPLVVKPLLSSGKRKRSESDDTRARGDAAGGVDRTNNSNGSSSNNSAKRRKTKRVKRKARRATAGHPPFPSARTMSATGATTTGATTTAASGATETAASGATKTAAPGVTEAMVQIKTKTMTKTAHKKMNVDECASDSRRLPSPPGQHRYSESVAAKKKRATVTRLAPPPKPSEANNRADEEEERFGPINPEKAIETPKGESAAMRKNSAFAAGAKNLFGLPKANAKLDSSDSSTLSASSSFSSNGSHTLEATNSERSDDSMGVDNDEEVSFGGGGTDNDDEDFAMGESSDSVKQSSTDEQSSTHGSDDDDDDKVYNLPDSDSDSDEEPPVSIKNIGGRDSTPQRSRVDKPAERRSSSRKRKPVNYVEDGGDELKKWRRGERIEIVNAGKTHVGFVQRVPQRKNGKVTVETDSGVKAEAKFDDERKYARVSKTLKPEVGDEISVFDGNGKKFSGEVVTSPKQFKSKFDVKSDEKTFPVKLDVENYRYKATGKEGVNKMADKKEKKKKKKKTMMMMKKREGKKKGRDAAAASAGVAM